MLELKSPAGTLKSALVALDAGADSVYVGLRAEGHQRAQLTNLSPAELTELCQTARGRGRKVFTTLNSSVLESDWQAAEERVGLLERLGVHGVIVADPGLAHWIAKHHPALKILFSVQGECSNIEYAKFLRDLGVHRIVLERNVSVREAGQIRAAVDVEVELFVFGFSCNSHDSLCYMGDYWSGSPCNVHCTQKVRFIGEDGLDAPRRYLFMKYYSALRYIPQFADAGIDGMKIEGRQRSSDFALRSTRVFRAAIDHHARCVATGQPFRIDRAWSKDLREAAMGFEVTDGFYKTNDYRRTLLEDPSVGTVARYAVDTVRNIAEGQTRVEFLRRSFVRHVQRGLMKPAEDDAGPGKTITGL